MTNQFFRSFIHIKSVESSHHISDIGNSVVLNNICITFSDDFNQLFIKNNANNTLGTIIGNPIRGNAFLCSDVFADVQNWDDFEALIFSLSGRYIVAGVLNKESRLYLDASGSLPIVYDPAKEVASSSPQLILEEEYETKLDTRLMHQLGMPKSGLWIPSGLTAHKGVYRVIPNHFLDLEKWIINRHWPSQEIKKTSGTDKLVNAIASSVKNTCSAVAKSHKPLFSITAGRDSRMLLACVRHLTKKSEFFTFKKFPGNVDTYYADKISKEYKLDHKFLKVDKPHKKQQEQWLKWNGHCISGGIWKVQHSLQFFKGNYAVMPAMAGEVGRSFYWKKDDRATQTLTASEMLNRLKLPHTEALLEASKNYVEGLPDIDFFSLLDLIYIEQRLGCWGNLSTYTGNYYHPHYLPLSSREIFTSMMSLPSTYRLEQRLCLDLIKKEWPELFKYPFNEYQGLAKLKKVLDYSFLLPSYIYRKILTSS
ncbi:MAG TPA: hypothetical protein VJ915_11795 [Balneolaceae bacterium]|nr:hypothetical protein [Balneolaceae bacterium]